MFGGILFRMIFWDLTRVFAVALLAITGILLMAGIVAEATQQGLGPGQILAAIPLLVPSTLPYTLPATTLFAVCVCLQGSTPPAFAPPPASDSCMLISWQYFFVLLLLPQFTV